MALQAFGQTAPPLTQANFEGLIVPQYMGSNESSGARRLPVVFRARVTGLIAGNTYRYYVQGSTNRDINKPTGGAGTALIITSNGGDFLYFSAAKLVADSSGILTADAQGAYVGWFAFVNSNNSRFGVDSVIRPSITLNEGGSGGNAGGNVVARRSALNQTLLCLKHDTSAGLPNGTGIYGSSLATPKKFVALYSDASATGRPVSATYVESEGQTVPSIVAWYNNNVDGVTSRWGTIIPNTSEGVRSIILYNQAGDILSSATSLSGTWGNTVTTNPAGGTTPLVIAITDAPLKIRYNSVENQLTVYPNPANPFQSLTIKTRKPAYYEVQSIDGKTILTGYSNLMGVQLHLPSGMYYIKTSSLVNKVVIN